MPSQPNRKRRVAVALDADSDDSDRPLASATAKRRRQPQRGSTESPRGARSGSQPPIDIEAIDLASIHDDDGAIATVVRGNLQAEQVLSQQKGSRDDGDQPPRLSDLTCVICLERPKNLTTTICGHLFCHTCLMEALIAGEGNGSSRCPVCRTTVLRTVQGKKTGGKGLHWQSLELKFKKKKKGESAAGEAGIAEKGKENELESGAATTTATATATRKAKGKAAAREKSPLMAPIAKMY